MVNQEGGYCPKKFPSTLNVDKQTGKPVNNTAHNTVLTSSGISTDNLILRILYIIKNKGILILVLIFATCTKYLQVALALILSINKTYDVAYVNSVANTNPRNVPININISPSGPLKPRLQK